MRRTQNPVSYAPKSKPGEESCSPALAEEAFRPLEGRWKLGILYHLFRGGTLRFSDLERALPGISQRMLAQQLRAMERDGLVARRVYAEVPPRVEYTLTEHGAALRPVLGAMLRWATGRPSEDVGEVMTIGGSG